MKIFNHIDRILIFAALIAGAANIQPAHAAATLIVNSAADTDDGVCDSNCTLREAVNFTGIGDTIEFSFAAYPVTIDLASEIALWGQIINGPGADKLTISRASTNNDMRIFKISSGAVIISNVTIANGSTTGDGGGIYNLGTLTLNGVVLANNSSSGTNGGGAIYTGSHAATTINNSTFRENTSSKRGGGIANYDSYNTLVINNSTFSANTASNGNGGGVFSFGALTIYNSTFSGNTSTANGSGVYNGIGLLTLKNSIIANGSMGAVTNIDCYNGATTKTPVTANNLIESNATGSNICGTPTETADPALTVLGSYGGSTPTFGLLPASPAIDAGDNAACLTTDQRGISRPQDGDGDTIAICDIGAFEYLLPDTKIDSYPPDNSADATFAFSSTDVSATFECQLDADPFSACSSTKTYTGLIDGSHTFMVRAKDTAGNADATPASYPWTIDTVAPKAQFSGSAPASVTNETSAAFYFSSTDGIASSPRTATNIFFAFSNSNSSVDTFECALDSPSFSACVSGITYTGLNAGQHIFQVIAKDAAGNPSPPISYTWTIDLTEPDTQINSSPPNPSYTSSASFVFSSTNNTAAFECTLDDAAFIACSSPQTYSELAQGSHTFQVRAKDPGGNVDSTPASHSWVVAVKTITYPSLDANDGWLLESTEFSNKANTKNVTGPLRVGDDIKNKQYRSILHFDTSSLPNNAVIKKASLQIKSTDVIGTDPFTTHGNLVADVKKGFFGSNTLLDIIDFQVAGAPINTAGKFIDIKNNWYQLTLSPANFKYVNLIGPTQFRLRFEKDDNNDKHADFILLHVGENTEDHPLLTIEYYIP